MPQPGETCPACLADVLGRSPVTHLIECDRCGYHFDDRPANDSYEDDGDWQRDCDVEEAVLHEHFDYYE